MAKQWWHDHPRERYWLEITGRDDIGADLRAPQTDESGQAYWGYSLIREIVEGDVVLHYHTPSKAIVGVSHCLGPLREESIVWAARGTAARSNKTQPHARPGWILPLTEFRRLATPITIADVDARREQSALDSEQAIGIYGRRRAISLHSARNAAHSRLSGISYQVATTPL